MLAGAGVTGGGGVVAGGGGVVGWVVDDGDGELAVPPQPYSMSMTPKRARTPNAPEAKADT
jgi:hypothetical protein